MESDNTPPKSDKLLVVVTCRRVKIADYFCSDRSRIRQFLTRNLIGIISAVLCCAYITLINPPRPSLPAVQLLNGHLRSDDWTEFTCSSQSASKTIQQSRFWSSIHLHKVTDYACIIRTWNTRWKQTHFRPWTQFPIMCGKRENQSKVTYKHSNTYGFSFTYTFTLFTITELLL